MALGLRSVAAPVPTRLPHRQRSLYDAGSGSTLPGRAVRSEGQAPTGDQAVDEAYDALGATFDLYWDVYDRDSIDDAGMELVGSVHYLSNYDNAFWNGTQMVFGDGDGTYFNRFTSGGRRRRPRAHARRHRARGESHLPRPAGRAERVGLRRLRIDRQAVLALAAADRRRGRLADRRGPLHSARERGGAPLDEGPGHGVRRPGAREGSAAGPHERLRRRRPTTTAASTSTRASRTARSTSRRSRSAATPGSGPGRSGTRRWATRACRRTRSSRTSRASRPTTPAGSTTTPRARPSRPPGTTWESRRRSQRSNEERL